MKEKVMKVVRSPLTYALIICIVAQVIVNIKIDRYRILTDTSTYVEEYTQNILKGEVNAQRTPIYPYIVKLIQTIGGQDNMYSNIVYVQYALMFISIILFYLCLKELTNNKILQGVGTTIYGICPYIFVWNNMILTESIAISGIVLLIFLLLRYIKNNSIALVISINIVMFLLIMLRPAYIYLLPIIGIFILLQNKDRKSLIAGIISFFVVIALILGYCGLMKINHGKFGITAISNINRQIITINNGNFKRADNENIKEYIEYEISKLEGYDPTQIYNDLYKIFNKEDVDKFFNQALNNGSTINEIKSIVKRAIGISDEKIGITYVKNERDNSILDKIGYNTMPINFSHVYIILILAILYIVYNYKKGKKIDIQIYIFTTVILANLFTNLVAAPSEMQRLFATSIPCVIMLLICFINIVLNKMCKKT